MAESGHIFEHRAKHLEAKVSGLVMLFIVVGGLVGAVVGGVPLLNISNGVVPHHLGYATLLIGAGAGAYLGWSLGERRAVPPVVAPIPIPAPAPMPRPGTPPAAAYAPSVPPQVAQPPLTGTDS